MTDDDLQAAGKLLSHAQRGNGMKEIGERKMYSDGNDSIRPARVHHKRVLLVTTCWENIGAECSDNSHYPLGLGYIHSYIESQGHQVKTQFLNNHPYEYGLSHIIDAMTTFKPDIVGFQILTQNRTSSFRALEYIHANYPEVQIVIGGIHATIMYHQIIEKYPYVIAVLGEGEITFSELISGKPLETVQGIAYSEYHNVIKTADRDSIENLDLLPFPAHEVFFTSQRDYACIITSRGCPNSCSFCVLNPVTKHKVRFRSVNNVISEIEYLIKRFPLIKSIWIHDDSFFLKPSRVIELCEAIVSHGIKLQFTCSARFKPLTTEMVRALEAAGFTHVLFGLESGNAEILKRSHKGITRADAVSAFKLLKKSPIRATIFLIVGLPGETEVSALDTAIFIQELQKIKYSYFSDIGVLVVYPGTEVYEIAKEKGIIDDSYWISEGPTPLYIAENTEKELLQYKNRILDYISCDRLFTLEGFTKQWQFVPRIYSWKFRYFLIPGIKEKFWGSRNHP